MKSKRRAGIKTRQSPALAQLWVGNQAAVSFQHFSISAFQDFRTSAFQRFPALSGGQNSSPSFLRHFEKFKVVQTNSK